MTSEERRELLATPHARVCLVCGLAERKTRREWDAHGWLLSCTARQDVGRDAVAYGAAVSFCDAPSTEPYCGSLVGGSRGSATGPHKAKARASKP